MAVLIEGIDTAEQLAAILQPHARGIATKMISEATMAARQENAARLATKRALIVKQLAGVSTKVQSDQGLVTAVVNSGEKDKQGDTMAFGCWKKVISDLDAGRQAVALCWQHSTESVCGVVKSLEELPPGDPRVPGGVANGLLMTGQFLLGTQLGREAFECVKAGAVTQWSVQFGLPMDGSGQKGDGQGGKIVSLVDVLLEVSPVLLGASRTTTLSVKDGSEYAGSSAQWLDGYYEGLAVAATRMAPAAADEDDREAAAAAVSKAHSQGVGSLGYRELNLIADHRKDVWRQIKNAAFGWQATGGASGSLACFEAINRSGRSD